MPRKMMFGVRLERQLTHNSTRAYRIKLDAWGFRKNNRPHEKARKAKDEGRPRAQSRGWSLSSEDTRPNDDDSMSRLELQRWDSDEIALPRRSVQFRDQCDTAAERGPERAFRPVSEQGAPRGFH